MATQRPSHRYFEPPTPRVLAHRGLATRHLENSLDAFAAAVAAGCDYIETDAHTTADDVAVLVHDPDFVAAGERHVVASLTLARLRELMPHGGAPTLVEALEAFPTSRFNIDVKADAAPDAVARAIAAAGAADRVLITSFDEGRRTRTLRSLNALGATAVPSSATPSIVVRALVLAWLGLAKPLRGWLAGVDAMQVPERRGPVRVVTRRFIRAMHAADIEVHVWTVNEPADIARLLDLGVDGIVTDRCDLALPIAEQYRAR